MGALAAARAGRWADRGQAQRASGLALALLALAWVPLAFTGQSLWALLLGILLLDAAGQAACSTRAWCWAAATPPTPA